MPHLTLQEVIDRINLNYPFSKSGERTDVMRMEVESPHGPEYYVPRVARLFANLLLGA